MTDLTIPLSHLALDVGISADELARRFADVVLADDLGRPSIDRPIARDLITAHRVKVAAQAAAERERDEAHRAALTAQSDAIHARVKAIADRQAAQRADGIIAPDATAAAVMCGSGKAAALDRAGRRFDELLALERRGELGSGYRFLPTKEI